MLYPASTSMMPVVASLARFLENNGFGAVFGNYPYWYLGVPFRYLGGPVVSFLLAAIHLILPQFSLFEIYFFLIVVFLIFGGVNLYFLVKTLGQKGFAVILAASIFLIGPFLPLFFSFNDGLSLIALSFAPLIFLLYFQILKNWSGKKALLISILIAFVLLINNLILPSLLIGLLSILLAIGDWKDLEEKIKKTILIVILGWALSTLWYTPSYWLHLLSAPSFAGKGLGSVIILLIRLLSVVIPVFLATLSIKKFHAKENILKAFTLFWLFIFGFLTTMRFLSDPDFWQDWISYSLELQMGGSILLAMAIDRLLQPSKLSLVVRSLFLGGIVLILILPWLLAPQKFLGVRKDITGSVEYKAGRWLSENVKPNERVYLSGTTAFWLNSLFDLPQVRGGADQAATHPFWAKASYEIREGENGQLAVNWLKALGVSYLAVHPLTSSEYYHDFKYPEKFEELSNKTEGSQSLKKVFSDMDTIIYMIEGVSLARIINIQNFNKLMPPKDGANSSGVSAYVSQLGSSVDLEWVSPNDIRINGEITGGEGISVAVTWDPQWKCEVGRGKCQVKKDVLGNILVEPGITGKMEIVLRYD
ncbi:hypothetical protein HY439_03590 [Candidatus Microgenomates bacterium]|nr:hypothetical protein [Candidatus Microgenomates bacterium]